MKCNIPAADLAQKLNDTICRYKGQPVYVRVDRSVIILFQLDKTSTELGRIKANDPDFDISGVPLGYMQNGMNVIYLTRFPQRRTKQGLDHRAIRAKGLNPDKIHKVPNLFSEDFVNMVNGKYPELNQALAALRVEFTRNSKCGMEVAITRNIALSINEIGVINVYYKNNLVGYIQPDKFTVHVSNSEWSWVISKYLSHELSWKVD